MSGAPRQPEDLRVADVISSAVALARWPGVRVCVDADAGDVHAYCHRGALVHALFNLIDNAGRASAPGAEVRVRVHADDDRVRIEIIDSGPGLPDDLARGVGRAQSCSGSGYGILAARRFLGQFGAELAFERAATGGTACLVSLPRSTPVAGGCTG